VLIANMVMDNYNERCIPELITINFSNGETVRYQPSGDAPCERTQLARFEKPSYDIVDGKVAESSFEALEAHYTAQLRSVDDSYTSKVTELETLHSLVTSEIKDFSKKREKAIDQLYSSLSKGMLTEYQNVKKTLDRGIEALKDHSERLKLMTRWLYKSKVPEMIEAAKILQSEAHYILKRLGSPLPKWDSFLSHVQKDASDVCRNIQESLSKVGVNIWYDKLADRVDNRGMTNGVIDSRLFTLVLTKDYFKRPYCIFEYCLAVVARKPVIVVLQSDPRFGGGPLNEFDLEGMFKHILTHEVIEIHRTYWNAFVGHLHKRIQKTLKANPWKRSKPSKRSKDSYQMASLPNSNSWKSSKPAKSSKGSTRKALEPERELVRSMELKARLKKLCDKRNAIDALEKKQSEIDEELVPSASENSISISESVM